MPKRKEKRKDQGSPEERPEQDDQEQPERKNRPSLKLVPSLNHEESPLSTASKQPSTGPAFLQLFLLFQEQKEALMHGLGIRTYKTQDQKKTGRFKKGAILDDKAE